LIHLKLLIKKAMLDLEVMSALFVGSEDNMRDILFRLKNRF